MLKNKGFSLPEILIASAALAGLAIVGMQMTSSQMKSAKAVAQRSDIQILIEEVRSVLSLKKNCIATFHNIGPSSSKLVLDKDVADTDELRDLPESDRIEFEKIYTAGENDGDPPKKRYGLGKFGVYSNETLEITSFQVGGYLDENTFGNVKLGRSSIWINIKKTEKKEKAYGASNVSMRILMQVRIDATTRELIECNAAAVGGDGFWMQNPNGIHYADGFVGVGTALPDANLHIKGTTFYGNTPQSALKISSEFAQIVPLVLESGYGSPGKHPVFNTGRNAQLVILNPNDEEDSNTNIAFINTTTQGNGGFQFIDSDPNDHHPKLLQWDGSFRFDHREDAFMFSTLGLFGNPPHYKGKAANMKKAYRRATGGGFTKLTGGDLQIYSGEIGGLVIGGYGGTGTGPADYGGGDDKNVHAAIWLSGAEEIQNRDDNSWSIRHNLDHTLTIGRSNKENSIGYHSVLEIEKNNGPGSKGEFTLTDMNLKINNGDVVIDGSTVTPSDIRLKKNIQPLSSVLEKVKSLKTITYLPKNSNHDEKRRVGVIAQDLEKYFPELVHTDDEGFKAVDYQTLSVILIKALQEQKQKYDQDIKEIVEYLDSIDKKL